MSYSKKTRNKAIKSYYKYQNYSLVSKQIGCTPQTLKKWVVQKGGNYETMEYPYLCNFISLTDVKQKFKKLKNTNIKIYDGTIDKFTPNMKIDANYNTYKDLHLITDYFSEKCRVKCVFKGNKNSPIEYFKKNRTLMISRSTIKSKFDVYKFNDIMYNSVKFCNNFPIIVAYAVYKIFKATKIYDSSAGWGDRLIAAILADCEYIATDPSKCLQPVYKNIIKSLNPTKDCQVLTMSAEDYDVKKNYYDLAFTSPPFFDLEVYETNKNQSISRYTTSEIWEKKFLIPIAQKNISCLKKGGHFVLYIDSHPHFEKFMKQNKEVKYLGELYFMSPKQRGIHVWEKL